MPNGFAFLIRLYLYFILANSWSWFMTWLDMFNQKLRVLIKWLNSLIGISRDAIRCASHVTRERQHIWRACDAARRKSHSCRLNNVSIYDVLRMSRGSVAIAYVQYIWRLFVIIASRYHIPQRPVRRNMDKWKLNSIESNESMSRRWKLKKADVFALLHVEKASLVAWTTYRYFDSHSPSSCLCMSIMRQVTIRLRNLPSSDFAEMKTFVMIEDRPCLHTLPGRMRDI